MYAAELHIPESGSFEQQRARMVTEQLRPRGILDHRVLAAMSTVPRHLFVPLGFRAAAYDDTPVPVGHGFHLSIPTPAMVGALLQAAELEGNERIFEVGTGTGYTAALLGHLAKEVYTSEIHQILAEVATHTLTRLGIHNVRVVNADGTAGCTPAAPFDVVLLCGGVPEIPKVLMQQLTYTGRLLAPVGTAKKQTLVRVTRDEEGFHREDLGECYFDPLVGRGGFETRFN